MNVAMKVDGLRKTYGTGERETHAIGRLSFAVQENEFVVVVGPSGCGKTTLLKCMSGLLPPTDGTVTLQGRALRKPARELALVFQEYGRSLMPWLTVRQNVRLPLRRKDLSEADRRERVERAVASVGLTRFIERFPWELSGGMQQRVAIARALAYQPEVMLLDEPFASVDAQTRADLEDLLLTVRAEYGVTIVFVTHDIDESVYLGDRIVVLGPSPTYVQEVLEVDLPHPRHQVETKGLRRFADLRAHVYGAIKKH